jgi:hypothetical protein
MRSFILVVTSLFPVVSACDGTVFSVELDAPEICVHGLQAPFGPSQSSATFEDTLSDHDLGPLTSDKVEPEIEVLSVGLAPSFGVSDLGFVDDLIVEMAPLDATANLPPLELMRMSGTEPAADGGLYSEPETAIDITSYLAEGEVVFSLELAGDIPAQPWTATLDICLHARGKYSETIDSIGN